MKTALVTGATGGLGRALVARLREDGHYHVVPTSRYCDDPDGFRLDVCDYGNVSAAISRVAPDLVMHLAGTLAGDFDEAYEINVKATQRLLEMAQKSGSRMRVIVIGSAAEYGLVRPEENPIHENRVLNPVSIYGMTKAWQTQLAGLYATRGVDVVVARIFNLDGPGLSERLFIGRLQRQIEEVLAGRKSVIELGPLCAIRDYVSTDDASNQILAIAKYAEAGQVYHVASGVPVSMRDMLSKYLTSHGGLDPSIVKADVKLSNHIGYDVPAIYANTTKTMRLIQTCGTNGET